MVVAVVSQRLIPLVGFPFLAHGPPRLILNRSGKIGMDMQGWIKLHRTLLDHPFWLSQPFTKPQAWVDLLLLANHAPDYFFVAGQKIPVERGQVGRSLLTLGKRWKWSRGKVNRFMKFLQNERMVELKTGQHTSIVTICNYSAFQDNPTQDGTTDGHQTEQQTDTKRDINKNVKNVKKKTGFTKPLKAMSDDELYRVATDRDVGTHGKTRTELITALARA